MDKIIFERIRRKHEKVLIIGGGESLIGFDMNKTINFDGAIIVINYSIKHVPRADYWITLDPMTNNEWGVQDVMINRRPDCEYFCAIPQEWVRNHKLLKLKDNIHFLNRIKGSKLRKDHRTILFMESGFAAFNLAYHFDAKKIIMLGLDGYGFGHWYDTKSPYNATGREDFQENYLNKIREYYDINKDIIEDDGIEVINGSPDSIIDCFPRMKPEEALVYFD